MLKSLRPWVLGQFTLYTAHCAFHRSGIRYVYLKVYVVCSSGERADHRKQSE